MATLPDIVLTGTAYQNLNTLSTLIAGTPLAIQNKGSAPIRVIISPTQPAANSQNGQLVAPLSYLYIQNETDIVWGNATQVGNTHISVQQIN